MAKNLVAGVSFSDNAAYVAVLELHRGRITVVQLEEHKNGRNGELWFLERLLRNRKAFRKVSKVSVALDGRSIIQHTFPMDVTLTPREQSEQLQWELGNFVQGFEAGERITEVHELRPNPDDQFSDMYVASARRS